MDSTQIIFCNKITYSSRSSAKKGAKRNGLKYNTIFDVYYCAKCDCWHLTSYNKSANRKIKTKR